jgi:hypothetical protein
MSTPETISSQGAPVKMRVAAELNGWPVDLEFSMPPASLDRALARLAELGYTPRQTAAPGAPSATQQPRPVVEPTYKPDGTPCCPVHKKPLSEGQYGLFCSAKAKDGQAADKKGYCGLKFDA